MCKSKDCQHEKESPIKDWKHRCKFGPDGKKLKRGTLIKGWNDIGTLIPDLSEHCVSADLSNYLPTSKAVLNWKCKKCGYCRPGVVRDRINCLGLVRECKCCVNKIVVPGINDMLTTHKKLAKECLVDPRKFVAGTAMLLPWKCCVCGHKWKAKGNARVNGSGCDKCKRSEMRKKFSEAPFEKSLAFLYPHLVSEYLGDRDPRTIFPSSGYECQWRCSKCSYTWTALVSTRTRGHGCKYCQEKGYKASKRSFIYLVHQRNHLKVGIYNDGSDRLKIHGRNGWSVLDLIESSGVMVWRLEKAIKTAIKSNGIPTGKSEFLVKFDGYTEAWLKKHLYSRSIRGLCRKLSINLDAFLAA